MKHKWKLRQDGTPDVWAWESEFHNGVYCERCGKTVCIHCHDDWEEMDDCVENKTKLQTNADRIRVMSDEELGRFCVGLAYGPIPQNPEDYHKWFMEWLKQPVKDGEG